MATDRDHTGFFFSRAAVDSGPSGPAKTGLLIHYDVPVPMTDGTVLMADVFRPETAERRPVILIRTPYDKLATAVRLPLYGLDPLALARAGYVVVIQDTRGAFASQGNFRMHVHEADDGADTIAWAAAQEWSNGSVGMAGASYLGYAQLLAAIRKPPALKAIAPTNSPITHYQGAEYQGGAFQLGRTLYGHIGMAHAALIRQQQLGVDVSADLEIIESMIADPWQTFKRLPLVELSQATPWLSDYGKWLAHPEHGDVGRETAIDEHMGLIDVPGLHIGGWYDLHVKATLDTYARLRDEAASGYARNNQRLIITPSGHGPPSEVVGDVWFGAEALMLNFQAQYLEYFDTFLRNKRPVEQSPVQLFVMGANKWREEDDWPLARAVPTPFYLRADGRLTRDTPSDEAADVYVYDPRDPVPTVGGNTLLPGGGHLMGPRDRRGVEQRPDVLVYTTDVLTEDTEVTGPVTAQLHVATSAPDTDFTVGLVDVHPDGRAIGIADGILRLRYRDGFVSQNLARAGQVYEIKVDLLSTSNVFLAGHRICVEISSSNFPRFDRNPNHGGIIAEATETDLTPATQRIFHDANRASQITLPVIPAR